MSNLREINSVSRKSSGSKAAIELIQIDKESSRFINRNQSPLLPNNHHAQSQHCNQLPQTTDHSYEIFNKLRIFAFKCGFLNLLIMMISGLTLWLMLYLNCDILRTNALQLKMIMSNIVYNLNQHLLTDLKIINPSHNCPFGYDLLTIPNLDPFEFTPNSNKLDIDIKPSTIWRNYTFCAKYYSPIFNKNPIQGQCPDGFKSCFIGSCIPNSQNCPITHISYNPSKIANSLMLTRDSKSPGIIGFNVALNGKPCYSDAIKSMRKCDIVNTSANYTLDQYSLVNFLKENNARQYIPLYSNLTLASKSEQQIDLVIMRRYELRNSPKCANFEGKCFNYIQENIVDFGNFVYSDYNTGGSIFAVLFIIVYAKERPRKRKNHFLDTFLLIAINIGIIIQAIFAFKIINMDVSNIKLKGCVDALKGFIIEGCFVGQIMDKLYPAFMTYLSASHSIVIWATILLLSCNIHITISIVCFILSLREFCRKDL